MAGRYEIIKIKPYADYRGELKKVFTRYMLEAEQAVEEIYVLYTNKGSVRGNHYHKNNIEFFSVLKGTATIALKGIEDDEADFLRISAEDDVVLKVPENVGHGFRNDDDEALVILAAASRLYEPDDSDTYAMKLL